MKLISFNISTLILSLSVLLSGCTVTKLYTEGPEDWQLFCTPLKSRCYGETLPDPAPPYVYTNEFPQHHGSFSLEVFDANERGRIHTMIDSNAIWLTPDNGSDSRLFRLARHHQSKISGYSDHPNSILIRLLGTQPMLVPTDKLKRRIQIAQSSVLKHQAVEYQCLGMDSSGAAGCFLRIKDKYDLGEWFISKGLSIPIVDKYTDKRYLSAYQYAEINGVGLHNTESLERSLFPAVKRDMYGFCRILSDPHVVETAVYAIYQSMEECLFSGGIRPKYTN